MSPSSPSARASGVSAFPVHIHVEPAVGARNRLTTAFRLFLAIPHLILVGGAIALPLSWTSSETSGSGAEWGAGGVLGAAAFVVTVIAWFAILLTGRHTEGLWSFAALYLRWRVRAAAYVALLRDEYPPFGEGPYPVRLELAPTGARRDRLTVAFRPILAVPHLLIVWALGIAWAVTTVIAWFSILLTGHFPHRLYDFGVGVLRWTTRVEAYLLLLRDEYPPFSLA